MHLEIFSANLTFVILQKVRKIFTKVIQIIENNMDLWQIVQKTILKLQSM